MPLYKQPNSPFWWASISVPGQPRIRRSTGESDRTKAQRVHDEWKSQAWQLSESPSSGRSWSQAIDAWLEVQERSTSELYSLAKLAKLYPDRPIEQVTAQSLEDALSFCKTAGTYTRYRTLVTAILNVAKDKKWIKETPKLVVKKDRKKKTRKWLTPEQWHRLYKELPLHMKPMAEFAIETGLRQSNVLGLRWEQVDLRRRFVWLEAEDTKDDDALPVPLSSRAAAVLRDRKKAAESDEFVFTYCGRPISEIKTAFLAACVRAELGRYEGSSYSGFTWHGLRHTWATWHVQRGTPLDVLQKLGGWSDLRMVSNYGHHTAGSLARYVERNERADEDRALIGVQRRRKTSR